MSSGTDNFEYPTGDAQVTSRAGHFDEETAVKTPAMLLLGALGWEEQAHLQNEWLSGTSTEGRSSMRQVILQPRLLTALQALNPDLPETALQKAVDVLIEDRRAMPPQDAAKQFHGLLRSGVKVTMRNDNGGNETQTIRIIDWANPRNNHFFLADEFWVQGEIYKRRLDIVGFVNGIPLLHSELKAPDVSVKHNYDDNLRAYLTDIPQFFTPNGLVVLSLSLIHI